MKCENTVFGLYRPRLHTDPEQLGTVANINSDHPANTDGNDHESLL